MATFRKIPAFGTPGQTGSYDHQVVKIGVPTSNPDIGYAKLYTTLTYVSNNLAPLMTSFNTPSGVATESSYYSSLRFWVALANNSNGWLSSGVAGPHWVKYKFDTPTAVNEYEIAPWSADNFPARSPKNWVFEGSHDDISYTTIDTITNFSGWVINTLRRFVTSNTIAYTYYRIIITANVGGDTYTGMKGVKLLGYDMNNYVYSLKAIDEDGITRNISI